MAYQTLQGQSCHIYILYIIALIFLNIVIIRFLKLSYNFEDCISKWLARGPEYVNVRNFHASLILKQQI